MRKYLSQWFQILFFSLNLKILKTIITFTLFFFHFSFGTLISFDASILFGFKQYILSPFSFVLYMEKRELQPKCYREINLAKRSLKILYISFITSRQITVDKFFPFLHPVNLVFLMRKKFLSSFRIPLILYLLGISFSDFNCHFFVSLK